MFKDEYNELAGVEDVVEVPEEAVADEPEPDNPPKDEAFYELVRKVLAGQLGLGEKRREALGERYDEVMEEVTRRRLRRVQGVNL